MKRFLISMLLVLLFTGVALAAAPTVEENQVLVFTAADQETTKGFCISTIAWLSDQNSGKDIAADDDMLLENGVGTTIIGMRAEATADDLQISFNPCIYANGLKAEDLDGGYLHVYGTSK
jgi:hypothetical protein